MARLRGLPGGLRDPGLEEAARGEGAHPQRPLWASTGVKDPAYSDTLYVTELVVADTVNTMPEKTLEAFADHGEVTGDTVTGRGAEAQQVIDDLEAQGISYAEVIPKLEDEGCRSSTTPGPSCSTRRPKDQLDKA